jgi:hypothetical protein
MIYTPAQRSQLTNDAVGRTIQSLIWEPKGRYWVMTFTDGAELCLRLMAEIEDVTMESENG